MKQTEDELLHWLTRWHKVNVETDSVKSTVEKCINGYDAPLVYCTFVYSNRDETKTTLGLHCILDEDREIGRPVPSV